jgi:hypothetical protein
MRFLIKPKGRYPEALQCKHTRPLSILSALSKIAEAAVASRLVYNTEACDEGTGLGESQSGFRPTRGCLHNLVAKVQAIKQCWRKGNFVVVLQRDVNKAYDRVWTKGLLYKLFHKTKIRGPLLRILASFLTGRSCHARVGSVLSACARLSGGVPQGAKLSPTLFAIDIDPQVNLVNNANNILGAGSDAYADDTDIWIELPGPKSGRADWAGQCRKRLALLQTDVIDESVILAAASKQTFATDPGKFRCVAFIQPNVKAAGVLEKLPYLYVEDKAVKITMTVDGEDDRTLGVTLDSRLNFRDHTKRVAESARARLTVLRRLKAAPWYADRASSLINVYRPWIASLWEHCSPLWGMAHPSFMAVIDEVEKEGLAICLGASHIRGRSRIAIVTETDSTSAQVRRLQAAAIFWNQVRNSHADSLLGQLLTRWKTDEQSPWKHDVDQALKYSCWTDRSTERHLYLGKVTCLDDENVNGREPWRHTITRAFISPLAFACAAAIKLGMGDEEVGLTESFGLRIAAQRIKPWIQDPLTGITKAAKSVGALNNEVLAAATSLRDILTEGSESQEIEWPIFGPAGSPNRKTKEANLFASLIQHHCFADAKQRDNGSLVCATDGSFVQKWGCSVLQPNMRSYETGLWKREGGGAGCAIFDSDMKALARWGVPLGRVGDSAGAEMHAMYFMHVALTRIYRGALAAREVDDINSPRETDSPLLPSWETGPASGGPPTKYKQRHLGQQERVVYILCDNQWVVNSTRTECLAAQPYRAGVKQRPGHSNLVSIVKAKRALMKEGIVIQALWIPGHTDGSSLNDTADLLADAASLKAALTGAGAQHYRIPSRCFRNTVKRRCKLLWRNEMFRQFQRTEGSIANDYMKHTVLTNRPTANWLLREKERELPKNRPKMWRWTQLPKGAVTTSKSRTIERCVSCIRMHTPTHTMMNAWTAGLPTPDCPWCGEVKDSTKHRFECMSLEPLRNSLAPRLRAALDFTEHWETITNAEVVDRFWSWDVLVAGQYTRLKWLKMNRFTTPDDKVIMSLSKLLHTFLRRSRFFYAAFFRPTRRQRRQELAQADEDDDSKGGDDDDSDASFSLSMFGRQSDDDSKGDDGSDGDRDFSLSMFDSNPDAPERSPVEGKEQDQTEVQSDGPADEDAGCAILGAQRVIQAAHTCEHCGRKVAQVGGGNRFCCVECSLRWKESRVEGAKEAREPQDDGRCDQCGHAPAGEDDFPDQPDEAYFNLCSGNCASHHREDEKRQLIPLLREQAEKAAHLDALRTARRLAMIRPGDRKEGQASSSKPAAFWEEEMFATYKMMQQRQALKGGAVEWIEKRVAKVQRRQTLAIE